MVWHRPPVGAISTATEEVTQKERRQGIARNIQEKKLDYFTQLNLQHLVVHGGIARSIFFNFLWDRF